MMWSNVAEQAIERHAGQHPVSIGQNWLTNSSQRRRRRRRRTGDPPRQSSGRLHLHGLRLSARPPCPRSLPFQLAINYVGLTIDRWVEDGEQKKMVTKNNRFTRNQFQYSDHAFDLPLLHLGHHHLQSPTPIVVSDWTLYSGRQRDSISHRFPGQRNYIFIFIKRKEKNECNHYYQHGIPSPTLYLVTNLYEKQLQNAYQTRVHAEVGVREFGGIPIIELIQSQFKTSLKRSPQ